MKAVLETRIDRRIECVVNHIARNPSATLGECARLVNLSKSGVSHLFRTAMGTSIVRYAINLRLDYADALLRTTDWPVKRIAIECGIPDGPNFARLFKRRFHRTASEHRAKYQSGKW